MFESRLTSLLAALAAVLLLSAPQGGAAEARLSAPGAPEDLVSALRAASLSLAAAADAEAAPQDILAAARADYARLVGVLYAQGYYGPVIHIRIDGREAAAVAPLSAPTRIGTVEIEVQPGPPFAFSRAGIGPLAPGTELPDAYAAGRRAKSGAIRAAARAGVEGWRAAGHAKADIAGQRITADHPSATLSAQVDLAPGPPVIFGDLVIQGPSAVRPGRLRAIAGLPVGERFDPEAVEKSAERLRRTGAFRAVSLAEAEKLRQGNVMDIDLQVTDAKPRRFGVGAELSSLEGLTLSGFWMHRNLLGGAERLRFDAEIAGIGGESGGADASLAARFDRPAVIEADTGLFAEATLQALDEPDFRTETAELSFGLTRVFSDRLSGEAGIALRQSEVEDDLGSRSLTHLMLPAALIWDGRDDPLDATRGLYLDFGLVPMLGLAGDAESGAQITADARLYRGLGERLVLAGRLQIGTIAGAGAEGVPPDMLFFSGGGGTVRGQPYQSLAVELGGGDRIGGRSFLGLSGEARVGVTGKIGVVAFADAGFIGPDALGGSGEWHSGAGLGVRYDTGIGPIRLDVAAPVGGETGDGAQIYIGIGQAF